MPTYEYLCDGCGHRFDEMQSFKDEVLKVCPRCAEEKLRRLFGTGAAILFKGSGFYETDYRSESYKKAAKAEQDTSASKPTETTKTDSAGTSTPAPAKTESKSSPPST